MPCVPEIYRFVRKSAGPATGHQRLDWAERDLADWFLQAKGTSCAMEYTRNIALFAVQPYWIRLQMLIGLTLAGMGQRVSLAYLPYGKYFRPAGQWDIRQQNLYLCEALKGVEPFVAVQPLLPARWRGALPAALAQAVASVTERDMQYIQQSEKVQLEGELYRMRLARNTEAMCAAYGWLRDKPPDWIVIPNGAIMEFEMVYKAARFLNIPAVTFEYSELGQSIWLAQNEDVMQVQTDRLWQQYRDIPLTETQKTEIGDFFAKRKRPQVWEKMVFRYQGVESEGGQKLRASLGLNQRPVVLLATNVIGDSVTLGRQIFTESMSDWLERTLLYFARRSDLQLVVRIHPGEALTPGPSSAEVVRMVLPNLPENIRLIPADGQVNTYDIIEIADLGLVYVTTAGLEMALSGVPVLTAGKTHYRGKGFTLDPDHWQEYESILDRCPDQLSSLRLDQRQVALAWNYAYRFFFQFPHPFPWHLYHIEEDLREWPLHRVLSPEGQTQFGKTFRYLSGEPIEW
jgi:hypothetical protein